MKCRNVLHLTGGAEEGSDWVFQVHAFCGDIGARDCGFHERLTENEGDMAWSITSDEFDAIQARHIAHATKGETA